LSFGGRNAGFVETEGFDFDLNYSLATDFGKFSLAWLNTYVSKNELKADNLEGVPSQQNGFGGNFRLRSNANVTWEKGPFGVTWSSRYYSGTKENCYFDDRCSLPNYSAPDTQGNIVPLNELGSNVFHDLQVRWNAPWNATVAVGANNVFEHYAAPAYDQPNSGYSYYGGYDIGRFVYMKYQQRF
jgi:iron complex outermembrane receptor protein